MIPCFDTVFEDLFLRAYMDEFYMKAKLSNQSK